MGVTTHYYGQIIVNEMCASYKRRETVGAACIDDTCGGDTQNRFVHCENNEMKINESCRQNWKIEEYSNSFYIPEYINLGLWLWYKHSLSIHALCSRLT